MSLLVVLLKRAMSHFLPVSVSTGRKSRGLGTYDRQGQRVVRVSM